MTTISPSHLLSARYSAQPPPDAVAELSRLAAHVLALVEAGGRNGAEAWARWLAGACTVYETEEGGALSIRECLEEHAVSSVQRYTQSCRPFLFLHVPLTLR